ncbi:MAG: ATP-binding protein [Myxococcota bacterium]
MLPSTAPSSTSPRASLQAREVLDFLRRVRWFAWLAQALLVLWAGVGLGITVEGAWLAVLLVTGVLSNVALFVWQRRGGVATENVILAVMLLDVVLYTAVFFLSGGPFNPFTVLYLVNVALGTLVLSRGRQWVQLAACLLGFASLFVLEKFAPESWRLPNHAELMRLHLAGMLVGFVVASGFIVAAMERLLTALRRRDAELEAARQLALRNEKLAALTTLAAGAAHELGTPLGTIAIASKELARTLDKLDVPASAKEDAALVREQVQRCRDILSRMSASSGELAAEGFAPVTVAEWLELALQGLRDVERVTRPTGDALALQVKGPKVALAQALSSLVRNGLQAARTGVELRVARAGDQVVVEVADDGPRLPDEVLARLGEPFFTTRAPGQGMGLGVFLARTLADQLGGTLRYASTDRGTVARLSLPVC